MRRVVLRSAVALGAAALLPLLPAAGADAAVRVVADALHNPRGLALGPGGVFVAEAGSGGSGPCVPGPEGGPVCFGTSGSVARVDPRTGATRRVARNLPSLAARDGARAIGPSDVAFPPTGPGYLTVGLGGNPALRDQLPPAGRGLAFLDRLRRGGGVRRVADLGAFEAARNPDAGQPGATVDTNPNSVDASGGRVAVADAGGNDVLAVRGRQVSLIAVIPFGRAPAPPGTDVPPGTEIPVQSVPTSVVRGPDGALYVGQLTGFPFPTGGASVWRIARGEAPRVFASGFTQITDLAFDRRGRLYVLEFATASMLGQPTPGALIRVGRDGRGRREFARGRLQSPTGLAIAGRSAFVSNRGTDPRRGELVRISIGGR